MSTKFEDNESDFYNNFIRLTITYLTTTHFTITRALVGSIDVV